LGGQFFSHKANFFKGWDEFRRSLSSNPAHYDGPDIAEPSLGSSVVPIPRALLAELRNQHTLTTRRTARTSHKAQHDVEKNKGSSKKHKAPRHPTTIVAGMLQFGLVKANTVCLARIGRGQKAGIRFPLA